ncbi:MAG: hypothetical protein BMS9Abin31_0522 [Gammaproteobacteria bacterium]|nr:MAG: hypothetical protein BMS9Abin31_0522 [Gammaproteobacteria bacterium]
MNDDNEDILEPVDLLLINETTEVKKDIEDIKDLPALTEIMNDAV